MNNEQSSSPNVWLLGGLLAASLAALVMSYQALSAARKSEASATTLADLGKKVEQLTSDIENMGRTLSSGMAYGRMPPGMPPMGDSTQVAPPRPPFPGPGSTAGAPPPMQPGNRGPSTPGQQGRVEVSPQIVADHKKELIDRNTTLHQVDKDKYGNELISYYNAARASGGPAANNAESEAALSQLLNQYPESNATAMALAEKAMQAAGRTNTLEVEQLYSQLQSNPNAASVVLDSGVEALPAIQSYLAHQYIQQGRTDEAEALLSGLASSSTSGLIAVPGPKGDPVYRPVSEVIQVMRGQIPSSQTNTSTTNSSSTSTSTTTTK